MKNKYLTTTKVIHFKLYLLKAAQLLSINSTAFTESDFFKSACGTNTLNDLEYIDLSTQSAFPSAFSVSERLEIVKFITKLIASIKECESEPENALGFATTTRQPDDDGNLYYILLSLQHMLIGYGISDLWVHIDINVFESLIHSHHSVMTTANGGKLTQEEIASLKKELSLPDDMLIDANTLPQVTRAYRKFALKNHPDKNGMDKKKGELFTQVDGLYKRCMGSILKITSEEVAAKIKFDCLSEIITTYHMLYETVLDELKQNPDLQNLYNQKPDSFINHFMNHSSQEKLSSLANIIRRVLPDLERRAENQRFSESLTMLTLIVNSSINLATANVCYTFGKNFLSINSLNIMKSDEFKSSALRLGLGSIVLGLLGSSILVYLNTQASEEESIVKYYPYYKEHFVSSMVIGNMCLHAIAGIYPVFPLYNSVKDLGVLGSCASLLRNCGSSIIHPTSVPIYCKLIGLSMVVGHVLNKLIDLYEYRVEKKVRDALEEYLGDRVIDQFLSDNRHRQ